MNRCPLGSLCREAVHYHDDPSIAVEALERLLRFTHLLTAANHQRPLDVGADIADLHFAEATLASIK